jgi:hypothetical protein
MTFLTAATLPILLAALLEVPAGGDVAGAVARAADGDVVALGPGVHAAALGRVRRSIAIRGAGPGATELIAPEGVDGLVVEGGQVSLAGLTLRAGKARSAVKVLGGVLRVEDAVLTGEATGAFVDGGRLEGRGVELAGGHGLLVARDGVASLAEGSARGKQAGVAAYRGRVELRRFQVVGPSEEAGVSISHGEALLEAVAIRAAGPSGLAVDGAAAKVTALELDVAGTTEVNGFLGDCVQVRRGTVTLAGGLLARCGGAAMEAMGGTVTLAGVDAVGGEAGCLVLVEQAQGTLSSNVCSGRGPGLVAASGAQATARWNRWRTDPALWVDCGAGARVAVGTGERIRAPCQGAANPAPTLDKSRRP